MRFSNLTFSQQPSEGKREEFRKYLEKNGVMDALTKVLVNLYEEPDKPEDALEYIRDRLAMQAGMETYIQLKNKLDEYQTRVDALSQEIEELKLNMEPTTQQTEERTFPEEGLDEPGEDQPPEEAEDAAATPAEEPQPQEG